MVMDWWENDVCVGYNNGSTSVIHTSSVVNNNNSNNGDGNSSTSLSTRDVGSGGGNDCDVKCEENLFGGCCPRLVLLSFSLIFNNKLLYIHLETLGVILNMFLPL